MSIKLSNSSLNMYLECPKQYELKYGKKIVNIYQGSALYFGSAIDTGLNYMLENKDNKDVLKKSIKVFDEAWEQGKNPKGEIVDLPKNPFITYSKYDFDGDLLEKSDWAQLFKMRQDPFSERNRIYDIIKETEYPSVLEADRMFYGYGNWLCLSRKGKLFIKAYYEQILPTIESVQLVQKEIKLDGGNGDIIRGFVDIVVKFKGIDGNIIADNKTSSFEYEESSVRKSQQLALYKTILNASDDTASLGIVKGAYIVLSKKIEKDITKTCTTCNHIATGSHKTCDNQIEGKRCNGSWNKSVKFKINTQTIIDDIPVELGNNVIDNFDNVVKSIRYGLFPRNYNSCTNKYGMKCNYFKLCHGGSMQDLVTIDPISTPAVNLSKTNIENATKE